MAEVNATDLEIARADEPLSRHFASGGDPYAPQIDEYARGFIEAVWRDENRRGKIEAFGFTKAEMLRVHKGISLELLPKPWFGADRPMLIASYLFLSVPDLVRLLREFKMQGCQEAPSPRSEEMIECACLVAGMKLEAFDRFGPPDLSAYPVAPAGDTEGETEGEAHAPYLPRLARGSLRRVYLFGDYSANLIDEIQAAGPAIQYHYVLFVFRGEAPEPCLAIASEYSDESSRQSPFLGLFPGHGHMNLGDSRDWLDREKFARQALQLAYEHVGLPRDTPAIEQRPPGAAPSPETRSPERDKLVLAGLGCSALALLSGSMALAMIGGDKPLLAAIFGLPALFLAYLAFGVFRSPGRPRSEGAEAEQGAEPKPLREPSSSGEMDVVLERLGIGLEGRAGDPKAAMVGAVAKTELYRAWQALEAGRPSEAVESCETAAGLLEQQADPHYNRPQAVAHYLCARARERSGEETMARSEAARAFRLAPDHEEIRALHERLAPASDN